MSRIFRSSSTQPTQAPSTSGGTSSTQATPPQVRQRSASFQLKALARKTGRALGLVSAPRAEPQIKPGDKGPLGVLMHRERPSKLTRAFTGVPQPGDSQPSSRASSRASSHHTRERTSSSSSSHSAVSASGESLPHLPVHEKGLVQFAAVAKWTVQGEGVSDASQHNGVDERISMKKINIDNETHKKPGKLAHMDETRAGAQGDLSVAVSQMVNLLKERMRLNGNPDEVAEAEEIREALAQHQFPESLVYEAKHFGLRTESPFGNSQMPAKTGSTTLRKPNSGIWPA
ncbi:hypothetical protein ACNRC9_17640 [Ralstonia pseudosolanacearum]|uniref:hypothetical protein n=1 Tax=Ralstonia pseudosolanacearum TaxID=1310165 RepID=UPI003AADAFAB